MLAKKKKKESKCVISKFSQSLTKEGNLVSHNDLILAIAFSLMLK